MGFSQRMNLEVSEMFWACHRGVDQLKVGKCHRVVVELLEFVASSHCPVAHLGGNLADPCAPEMAVCL